MPRPIPRVVTHRLIVGVVGVVMLFIAAITISAAAPLPPSGSGSTAPPPAAVDLNGYCEDPGAVGRFANGRTVYCVQVQRTDAFVWSYSPDPIARDPNTRGYTCDANSCHWPDGTAVPNFQRCGILCGEPPTSGDIQSGFHDCFETGTAYEECARRTR
ncbi:hypothetical protein HLB23_02090 [Nocardia uniformis]|uniref:Uncharacterized protein n=1 Tax=Nocardia uniformis TaxID=53432 RepID=A0A849C6S6_9NOCA|nr:hypothetical protein [Nocardia uniformis]NNH68681.1 hypothetical protein [Nocardia uniformis]